jgi:hypothetical protein
MIMIVAKPLQTKKNQPSKSRSSSFEVMGVKETLDPSSLSWTVVLNFALGFEAFIRALISMFHRIFGELSSQRIGLQTWELVN